MHAKEYVRLKRKRAIHEQHRTRIEQFATFTEKLILTHELNENLFELKETMSELGTLSDYNKIKENVEEVDRHTQNLTLMQEMLDDLIKPDSEEEGENSVEDNEVREIVENELTRSMMDGIHFPSIPNNSGISNKLGIETEYQTEESLLSGIDKLVNKK